MKKLSNYGILLAALAVALATAGCGSDTNATQAENDAFKSGAKPTVNIPPGANTPPPNFKSSLDNGGGPRPPAGAPGPGG